MGDVLKADEGPGGDKGDARHLLEDIGVRDIVGLDVPGAAGEDRRKKADADADGEHEGHHGVQAHGKLAVLHDQQGKTKQRQDGQQRLPQPDLVAEEGVELAEAEHVPEKIAGEERQACGVGPEDGEIGET